MKKRPGWQSEALKMSVDRQINEFPGAHISRSAASYLGTVVQ